MKQFVVFFLLCVSLFLSTNSYAVNSYPEVILCDIEHYGGEVESHHFYRKNDEFLWINGQNEILIGITFEDESFLFLNLAYNNFSMNLGINKKSRKILIDGMDLEASLSKTRTNGNCRFL
jgi:hypothetical protein